MKTLCDHSQWLRGNRNESLGRQRFDLLEQLDKRHVYVLAWSLAPVSASRPQWGVLNDHMRILWLFLRCAPAWFALTSSRKPHIAAQI